LKEQGVLPLPCVETIRRHLLAVKNLCGFEVSFFNLLEKIYLSYTQRQKKGILLIDEIYLRKNIYVNIRKVLLTIGVDLSQLLIGYSFARRCWATGFRCNM